MSDTEVLLVLTNLPDRDSALRVAQAVIEDRATACVNILGECTSVYRWQGKTETASEVPLLIKTTRAAYPRLEAAIRAHHPYELPEIIAVPLSTGLSGYLQWVVQETSQTTATPPSLPNPSQPPLAPARGTPAGAPLLRSDPSAVRGGADSGGERA